MIDMKREIFSSFPYLYLIKMCAIVERKSIWALLCPENEPFLLIIYLKSQQQDEGIIFKHLIEYYRLSAWRIYWHFTRDSSLRGWR